MKLAILLLSYFAIVRSQNFNGCPSAENIKPCTCSLGQDKRSVISCTNLKSATQLVKAVANMKGYSVAYFNLLKSNIGVFPSEVFSDMEVDSISIVNCTLTRLGNNRNSPPFLGLENSLRSIEIKQSFVDKNMPLASLSLSHLKKLYSLHLDGNVIPSIGNNWFENGPYGLKVLRLLNTSTSVVGSHAFEALHSLEYFALTGSSLPGITRDMLPMPASSLRSIHLKRNKLNILPQNIFSKMPSLSEIVLDNNYLTSIDEVTWVPVWSQLEFVSFYGDPIKCNNDIKWIYKYRLPEQLQGYCDSPANLRNKSLKDITISDLQ